MNPYSILPLVAGILTLAVGLVSFLSNRRAKPNATFFLVTLSVFFWLVGYALVYSLKEYEVALAWVRRLYVGVVFIPVTSFHFAVAITHREHLRRFIPWLYIAGIVFAMATHSRFFISGLYEFFWGFQTRVGPLHNIFMAFFFTVMGVVLYLLADHYRRIRKTAPLEATRIRYVLLSYGVSVVATIDFLPNYGFQFYPLGFLLITIHAITTTYAIVRYRLMDINLAVTRTAVFVVVYAAVLGLPLWGALTWQQQLEEKLGKQWWVWVLLTYAALATAAHYANMYFQRRAEGRLLAEQRRYQSVLRQAAQGMVLIKEMKKLLNLIVHLLTQKVRLRHAAIYLWDEKSKRFYPSAARQWPVKNPPTFVPGDALVEYLNWHRLPVVTEELFLQARGGAKELQAVAASLKNLQAEVMIPSFTEDRCEGFLLLGEKVSGALFTTDDLQVFQVLASQSALAIENAQFYEELKRTQADLFQTAKMASLGHMAGGMSHQINNRFHVLTILAGTLKAVMKDTDPAALSAEQMKGMWDKAVETLGKLEDNAFRGGDIVKTLLKFSRPSGDYKGLALAQVVKTAREVAQFRVNMATVDFQEDIPEDLPKVSGDLNQLADCVFNLITNAFDAIAKKAAMLADNQLPLAPNDATPFRGKLWTRAFREISDNKNFVVLEFQDNGVGMTSAELDNSFIPFFTTKATTNKGTGLGLYVIQRIIEQHGGTIAAKSKYGVGTTFHMRLPARMEADETSDPAVEQSREKVA